MPGFLETQVANLLEKVLGPFVIGLDKQSLNLSVWSGEVLLRDLQLRTEALDALPIPVKVGDEIRRVEMPAGETTIELGGAEWTIDPEGWILRVE